MKVRILVAVDANGDWCAWGNNYSSESCLVDDAWLWMSGMGKLTWLEADVPGPELIPVVLATVVP